MKSIIILAGLFILSTTFADGIVGKQQHFVSLPFSFGLVLSVYKSNPTEGELFQSQDVTQTAARDPPDDSGARDLQAISVAEVLREPALKRNRASPSVIPLACLSDTVLELDLTEAVLTSRQQHVAVIDQNHQLQFDESLDGPAQASKKWSVSAKGQLQYEFSDMFYQCHSGGTYKLYDSPIHSRCAPVLLDVVELVTCQ